MNTLLESVKTNRWRWALLLVIPVLVALGLLLQQNLIAQAADGLTVQILAGYNLVVDSNSESPSTYAPSVATVAVKYCNTSGGTLNDVVGSIGDYNPTTPSASTPGTYPVRNSYSSTDDFEHLHPELWDSVSPGSDYSFTHLGGEADAVRYIGALADGECSVQYWHFTYPHCEDNGDLPCSQDPVWGLPTVPEDDLWLTFDAWGTYRGASTPTYATWTMTMRNEISAMANKIKPNPDGLWYNTETNTVMPGDIITTNGVNYTFGNINKGFDNDGDYTYDYNAWMQPFGNTNYDPSCFRLIRTTGTITVTRSGGNPPMIVNFRDQLYFTNLPTDNTNVTGRVYYTFLALGGACVADLTPYQEAASGADNEKFNADFGSGVPPVSSTPPEVTIDKTTQPFKVAVGSNYTYTIPFQNLSITASAGLTLSSGGVNAPLVISDTIPIGTQYVASSATCSVGTETDCSLVASIVFYNKTTKVWTSVEPSAADVGAIQWWLKSPLPPSTSGYARFQVNVPSSPPSNFIENCAKSSFGGGAGFDEACVVTVVQGNNSIGDLVWEDDDGDAMKDASETGLDNITVNLYYDKNNDQQLDSGDVLIATQSTSGGGAYDFTQLPDARYLVQVDINDPQIPPGYNNSTPTVFAVNLNSAGDIDYNDADFGLGPTLMIDKVLVSTSPVDEGSQVTYDIMLTNTRPPSSGGFCTYTVWATALGSLNGGNSAQRWVIASEPNALGTQGPDGVYAYTPWSSGEDRFSGTTFPFNRQPSGAIQKVEALYSLYLQGTTTTDLASVHLYWNNALVTGAEATISVSDLNSTFGPDKSKQTLRAYDWTNYGPDGQWDWADFSGDLELIIDADRVGGSDGATLYMDALGFRVTTYEACGGAGDIIATLPLTDTYDADLLQFVSASPVQSSVVTNDPEPIDGRINWSNLGPLYGGQTKTVRVVFLALDPGAVSTSTTNTAKVNSGARFANGRPVNQVQDTADVTIYRTAKIGDTVWNNNVVVNALVDPGEKGIPGVRVDLCPTSACATYVSTYTDANGYYEFTQRDGSYYVRVNPPTGATQNYDFDGTLNNITAVSVSGTDVMTRDFGYTLATSVVYGKVWEDNNGNAVQGDGNPANGVEGENGFQGVTVVLCNQAPEADGTCKSNQIYQSTTTDSQGRYSFSNVASASYYLIVYPNSGAMSGYSWSQTVDPNGAPFSSSYQLTIPSAGVYGSYEFAYQRTPASSSIGDTIFYDWNGDGIQGDGNPANGTEGEDGIANVKISIYEDANGNGVVDPTTDSKIGEYTTGSTGYYNFSSLAAGNYLVVVDPTTLPAGYIQTKDPDQDGTCTFCDNKDPITVDGTSSYLNEDFGYRLQGDSTIGDLVWRDNDGDGIKDASEPGLANITVRLYWDTNNDGVIDSGDHLVGSTATDSNGHYLFSRLPAGNYLVDVDQLDSDLPLDGSGNRYVLSTDEIPASTNTLNGPDNDPLDVTLSSGQNYTDADFGFTAGGILGDYIWQDNDGDGLQDASETGLSGVRVWLCYYTEATCNGSTALFTDITDADGLYEFTSLPAYTYTLAIDTSTLPTGAVQTYDPDEPNNALPCVTCDNKSTAFVGAGQINRTQDFGYQPLGGIGDYVWFDADGDGVQDANEQGIGGVQVTLTLPGGGTATTTTDSDGYYSFGNLTTNGTYQVSITTPANMAITYDPDEGIGVSRNNTTSFTMTNGVATWSGNNACGSTDDCNLKLDYGLRYNGSYSISGTVFFDASGPAVLTDKYGDSGDTPYSNITVYLWDSNGKLVATTTTDSSGAYSFGSLIAGTYTVSVNTNSPQLDGMALAATPNPTYAYAPVTVNSGTPNATQIDFGFYASVDFGDMVNSYHTLLGSEGAGHITGDLYLGSAPTVEGDGQPSTAANLDSEDGITHYGNWNQGNQVAILVNVTGDNGYLVGFYDWNGDGDFNDPGEVIQFGDTVNGDNLFYLTVPSGANNSVPLNVRYRLYDLDELVYISSTGLATNGEVNDYNFPYGPTAVVMENYAADAVAGQVALTWQTSLEKDLQGFNIYRAASLDGERTQVNAEMIEGLGFGGMPGLIDYQCLDEQVEAGVTYYYWIVAVGFDGSLVTSQPIQVTGAFGLYLPFVKH
ncbi:MAG: SdrD B-like domain-containing protein [Chloroflexota bacterium]